MELHDRIDFLCKTILAIKTAGRLVLGIDGLSRSGKTTLANQLSQTLREQGISVCVFHMDDHIVERAKRYHTGNEEWFEYYYLQWDVEWLTHQLFRQLKASHQLTLPFYDHETDTHSKRTVYLSDSDMIMIEGVFLQRKEWRPFFDFVVYLDCPREIRFARENDQVKQNIQKFINRYWKAEDYYLETEEPIKRADVVFDMTS